MKPSREIRDLVLGFYHDMGSFSAGDPGALVSAEAGTTFIGIGPGEFWIGPKAIIAVMRAQDEEIGRFKIIPGTIYAFEEGSVGWATDECTFELPVGRLKGRLTFVFHREGDSWKLVHGRSCVPRDEQRRVGPSGRRLLDGEDRRPDRT